MYKREVVVPVSTVSDVRRRSAQPVRRRKRRRRKKQPLTVFCVLMLAAVLLRGVLSSPPGQTAEPVSPSTAGVLPAELLTDGTVDKDSWYLTLVNPWNPLPEDYTVTLKKLSNGHAVDERCSADLQAMMDDCRTAGLSPLICSSYRSQEKQQSLFENKVKRLMAQGYSKASAETEAGKSVAVPGTSEHQLGLAVDIVDVNNQNLDTSQEKTEVQKWLMAHSWEYGFILRYPNEKSEITGIIYEPWHYRYVGKDAAREIYEQGVCLEEYLDSISTQ